MKKRIKKIVTLILAAAFVLPCLPAVTVLADIQEGIRSYINSAVGWSLSYNNASTLPSHSASYSVISNWRDPQPSTAEHPTSEFRLAYQRGSTRPGTAEETYLVVPNTGGPGFNQSAEIPSLEPSSLYSFRVDSYHYHQNPPPAQPTPMIGRSEPILLLTDIDVSADGAGSSITVTWGNPTVDGQDVFDQYKIYYRPHNSDLSTIYNAPATRVVTTADCKITGGRLQYTITDEAIIKPGNPYDVAVMPMVMPGNSGNYVPLRGDGSRNTAEDRVTLKSSNTVIPIVYPARHVRPYVTPNPVYVKFPLFVEDSTDGNIRIWWNKLTENTITEVEVWESSDPNSSPIDSGNLIGSIRGAESLNLNYWFAQKPSGVMYYQIRIRRDGVWEASLIAVYDPAFSDFTPYRPNITDIWSNEAMPLTIDFEWRAFTRPPYNAGEGTIAPGVHLDQNVIYDVWVADSIDLLSDNVIASINPIIDPIDASRLSLVPGKSNPYVYSTDLSGNSITEYYTSLDDGSVDPSPKQLVDNKIYYVRIVARLITGEGDAQKETPSLPSFGNIYIPPLENVITEPIMITSPPLRVSDVKNNSVTIQWDARWYEVFDDATKTWYSLVGINPAGDLVFGVNANADGVTKILPLDDPIMLTDAHFPDVDNVKALLPAAVMDITPIRHMELKDGTDYIIHTARYETVAATGVNPTQPNPYLQYINNIIGDDAAWAPVSQTGTYPHFEYEVLTQQAPDSSPLAANMPYIIFLRPAIKINDLYAYYPAYVAATTLNNEADLDIVPTVPNIEDAGKAPVKTSVQGAAMNVAATDTTITVRWESNTNYTYELVYDELQANYPNGGTKVTINSENAVMRTEPDTGVNYYYYTIQGLFPYTSYYIWLRAIASQPSDWSNPLILSTKDIAVPPVPQGLGIASEESVKTYNAQSGTDYTPVASDYLILEWLVNYNDPNPPTSDNTVTGGNAELLSALLNTHSYLVKFNGLLPYTEYYARIKTVATVTKGGPDGSEKKYSYVLQLSLSDDFMDAIEVTIPPLVEITSENASEIRRRESEWSTVIRVSSGKTTGEFDGDKNPELYPLPSEDFEITYNSSTRTLNYRFRSGKLDASGNKDNGVDQRFISKLVNNRVFTYNIDLTSHEGYAVANRIVEIPYSIIKAFDERKINLRCKMGDMYVTIIPGALMTPEVLALKDLGAGATVKLWMDATGTRMPALETGSAYSTQPQRLSVQVITPTRTLEVPNASKAISFNLMVNRSLSTPERNIGAYIAAASQAWESVGSIYDAQTGIMTFSTKRIASYSSISKATPTVTSTAPSGQTSAASSKYTDAISVVNSKLSISDAGTINVSAQINANQFNKIVEAIASNKTSVAMNQPLSDSEQQNLIRAGMFVSGTSVTREAGIASLIRLYEVKTKASIKGFPTEQTTAYPDIKNATATYRQALLKAEYLGFYDTPQVNPKGALTFGEFFRMLSYVVEDMG